MFRKSLGLAIWVFIFQMIAFFIHQHVHFQMSTWLLTVQKSPLHLPEFLFPIIWSTLYVMMTIAGYLIWQERHHSYAKVGFAWYGVMMLMTWAWSPIIFEFHLLALGFFWTLGIFAVALGTMINTAQRMEFAATLIAPYLLWLMYVAYLYGYIWLSN
jgi:benzodiazapine receptor